ncbi:MAG: hypothetical protein JWO58_2029 [Chitinophagaceae bacterium]|nr:hypothetical protein [Chitinophagaceae bacterium]
MKAIEIVGTEDTPTILLDKEGNKFELAGRSLPEDAAEFYHPVLQWLTEYAANPNPVTELNIKLEYFNTASSKLLLDVLHKVEALKGVKIIWYYFSGDDDMQEAGEEFAELIEVPFEFKTY